MNSCKTLNGQIFQVSRTDDVNGIEYSLLYIETIYLKLPVGGRKFIF